jgi:hypothetical protein
MHKASVSDPSSPEAPIPSKGYRFLPDTIRYATWLNYRFPLSLRMVEETLVARSSELTYETVRGRATKFGLAIARCIRSTAPGGGDKRYPVVVTINGRKHLAVAARRSARRSTRCAGTESPRQGGGQATDEQPLKRPGCPRVIVTEKLHRDAAANLETGPERPASAAQRTEQPGGECAPVHAGAREGDASLQIGASAATILPRIMDRFVSVHGVPIQPERTAQTLRVPWPSRLGKESHGPV